MSLRRNSRPEGAQTGSGRKDGVEEEEEEEEEEQGVESALTEASTLQWRDRQTAGQTGGGGDWASVRSDGSLGHAASLTESERELKRVGGASEEGAGPVTRLEEEEEEDDEEEEGGLLENRLPEKAAQVFSPVVTVVPGPPGPPSPLSPREKEGLWEVESERGGRYLTSAPLQEHSQQGYQQGYQQDYQYNWREEEQPAASCGGGCPVRDVLKHGVSLLTSAMLFPFLVWGGFVFLPFDAPLLNSAPLRLVYTLRCSVFAVAPVVLGWLVLGFSRLRYGAVRPLLEEPCKAPEAQQAVSVHRHYVSDSASLFLLYFLQLAVMAMYLSQEQLKLVPLLTIVFALGRLIYWAAAAFGSSVRAFGFGLSFLPSVVMMVANFYFIFTVEAAGSIFSTSPGAEPLAPPPGKQRFWG